MNPSKFLTVSIFTVLTAATGNAQGLGASATIKTAEIKIPVLYHPQKAKPTQQAKPTIPADRTPQAIPPTVAEGPIMAKGTPKADTTPQANATPQAHKPFIILPSE